MTTAAVAATEVANNAGRPKRKWMKVLLVFIIACTVAILILLLGLFFGHQEPEKPPSKPLEPERRQNVGRIYVNLPPRPFSLKEVIRGVTERVQNMSLASFPLWIVILVIVFMSMIVVSYLSIFDAPKGRVRIAKPEPEGLSPTAVPNFDSLFDSLEYYEYEDDASKSLFKNYVIILIIASMLAVFLVFQSPRNALPDFFPMVADPEWGEEELQKYILGLVTLLSRADYGGLDFWHKTSCTTVHAYDISDRDDDDLELLTDSIDPRILLDDRIAGEAEQQAAVDRLNTMVPYELLCHPTGEPSPEWLYLYALKEKYRDCPVVMLSRQDDWNVVGGGHIPDPLFIMQLDNPDRRHQFFERISRGNGLVHAYDTLAETWVFFNE